MYFFLPLGLLRIPLAGAQLEQYRDASETNLKPLKSLPTLHCPPGGASENLARQTNNSTHYRGNREDATGCIE